MQNQSANKGKSAIQGNKSSGAKPSGNGALRGGHNPVAKQKATLRGARKR